MQPSVALRQFDQTPIAQPPSRICSGTSERKRLHLKHYSNVITPRSLGRNFYGICCNKLSIFHMRNMIRLLGTAGTYPKFGVAYSTIIWLNPLPNALQHNLDNLVIEENYQKIIRILMPGFIRGFRLNLRTLGEILSI